MNRSRDIVLWATVAIVFAACVIVLLQMRSCARRLSNVARVTPGKVINSCLPSSGQTELTQPNIVPPGHSARPRASRRPVFGKAGDEGVDVVVKPRMNTDEHGAGFTTKTQRHQEDSIRLRIRKDGTVQNVGGDTVVMSVTKYGPPVFEWDLSLGVCAFVSADRSEWMPVARRDGYAVDAGGKLKLMDFRPLRAIQIGVPVLYATTAVFGVGCDVKVTGAEWVAVDVGWFPVVKRMAVGVSVSWP